MQDVALDHGSSRLLFSNYQSYRKMPDLDDPSSRRPTRAANKPKMDWFLPASYVTDWLCLIAAGGVGLVLNDITPRKRPFSLQDQNISFPFTEHETVPPWLLMVCNAVIPIFVILIVALVFVPGRTVPKGTPKSLVWKRKLWELHTGWLGLALALIGAWFITNGMKNLFGKPRPDLLARCQPDFANLDRYIVGGFSNTSSNGQLVSAAICKNTNKKILDDGFRSYPSGHSSSAAAGLIYLSFFLASKFAVTIPFVAADGYAGDGVHSSFPSRLAGGGRRGRGPADEAMRPLSQATDEFSGGGDQAVAKQVASHSTSVLAVRRQAAAPPVYLLILTVLPFFLAIFVAGSRWSDYRHHGFDILFGFIIGTVTAWFSFRYYHLPISRGAGWAWGPRSPAKAFWAGVGSYSYATDHDDWSTAARPGAAYDDDGFGHPRADIEMGLRQRKPDYGPAPGHRTQTDPSNPMRGPHDEGHGMHHDSL
jgi:membrane-associated phospholipid phosphatase